MFCAYSHFVMFISEHFPWADWPSPEASSSLLCGPACKDRLCFRRRICHCEGDDESPLITPCRCTGSLHFVHQTCLQQWIKSSDTRCCELCKYDFIMETKLKPLRKVLCCLDQFKRAGKTGFSFFKWSIVEFSKNVQCFRCTPRWFNYAYILKTHFHNKIFLTC